LLERNVKRFIIHTTQGERDECAHTLLKIDINICPELVNAMRPKEGECGQSLWDTIMAQTETAKPEKVCDS
jgi:hypothetical protein